MRLCAAIPLPSRPARAAGRTRRVWYAARAAGAAGPSSTGSRPRSFVVHHRRCSPPSRGGCHRPPAQRPTRPRRSRGSSDAARHGEALGGRVGKPTATTFPGDVDLSERSRPTQQIEHDRLDEAATTIPPDRQGRVGERLRRRQTLLHRHREDQGSLPLGPCPQGTANGCDRRTRAWHPGGNEVIERPAPSLPDVEQPGPADPGTARHGHPDPLRLEPLQSGGDEG